MLKHIAHGYKNLGMLFFYLYAIEKSLLHMITDDDRLKAIAIKSDPILVCGISQLKVVLDSKPRSKMKLVSWAYERIINMLELS